MRNVLVPCNVIGLGLHPNILSTKLLTWLTLGMKEREEAGTDIARNENKSETRKK